VTHQPPETRTVVIGTTVAPGALVDVEVDGTEVVVWRGASGVLCAADARCPHQWSHLGAEGAVDGDELVCTSHFWRFAPDGTGCRIDGKGVRSEVTGLPLYAAVDRPDGTIEVTVPVRG
jgi:nitrite reductase/ring-hydroxylating ferredoxin subunit